MDNILPVSDIVIVVWSTRSNRGVEKNFDFQSHESEKVHFLNVEPENGVKPADNEAMKRNAGLDFARANGCTHFLIMDSDEFYHAEDVEKGKRDIGELNGLVCGLRVYIKPTLWCEDHTLVPFIQKLTPEVRVGSFKGFPFTYDKERKCHIDPTRRPSHLCRVEWSDIVMHHFSYVRKDIDLKIRNSSANLIRSRDVIHKELQQARPGHISLLYHRELKECEDQFKIQD